MRVYYINLNNVLKYWLHIKAIIIIFAFLLWILRILHCYFNTSIISLLYNIVEINRNQIFIVQSFIVSFK